MTPVAFTVRSERVDTQLLDGARREGSSFARLAEVGQGGILRSPARPTRSRSQPAHPCGVERSRPRSSAATLKPRFFAS